MNEEALYIGVPDKKIIDSEDQDILLNKIGGKPVWMSEKELKKVPTPPKEQLKCKICSSKLYLLSQIYAPLSDFDRFLYIFCCNNEKCQNKEGSILGLRGSCYAPEEEENKEEKIKENWKEQVEEDDILELIQEKKETVNKKKKNKKEIERIEYQFPCNSIYFFEDDYDSEDEIEMKTHEKKLYREYSQKKEKIKQEGEEEEDEEEDEEDDEQDAFQNFQQILANCPNQVVRSKFDMKVLWTTHKSEYIPKENSEELKGQVEIPKCSCGAKRVPEVQILPTSLYYLQPEKNCHLKENEGIDFGTMILYVCSKHCQIEKYVNEFVLVQPPFQ